MRLVLARRVGGSGGGGLFLREGLSPEIDEEDGRTSQHHRREDVCDHDIRIIRRAFVQDSQAKAAIPPLEPFSKPAYRKGVILPLTFVPNGVIKHSRG